MPNALERLKPSTFKVGGMFGNYVSNTNTVISRCRLPATLGNRISCGPAPSRCQCVRYREPSYRCFYVLFFTYWDKVKELASTTGTVPSPPRHFIYQAPHRQFTVAHTSPSIHHHPGTSSSNSTGINVVPVTVFMELFSIILLL